MTVSYPSGLTGGAGLALFGNGLFLRDVWKLDRLADKKKGGRTALEAT